MKKIAVLAPCAVITFSFASCQHRKNNVASSESIESTSQQVSNPFVDCETMDEACKTAGFDFDVPDMLEGIRTEISRQSKMILFKSHIRTNLTVYWSVSGQATKISAAVITKIQTT